MNSNAGQIYKTKRDWKILERYFIIFFITLTVCKKNERTKSKFIRARVLMRVPKIKKNGLQHLP